ncbi:Cyclomaltodextrinase [Paenibacillus plantiphilus]|uniref:Cyclomaltodextrinase n=1 Tax=Paenibacillus plantiphilus TaxID=2905650 RepID=A0ABM9CCR8_9BACL|nr:glycoside hydrolase family 13 protein [Paenibacillus plantiphilus]CAH1208067.1 Cyclomaltodextrinase [Paenibacillus plantiphilus]
MHLEAIYHRVTQNWAYAYDKRTLHIRIRTKKSDVARIDLNCADKYKKEKTTVVVPMERWASDDLFDYWEAAVQPPYRRLVYYFILQSEGQTVYFMEKGFFRESLPENMDDGLFDFPFLNPADVIAPPEWVKDAVFYQIFPERFANSDASLNPPNVEPWGGVPTRDNYFGGDLQGVIDHLDHLNALGVNAIYFNPIFEATTNHKYDTRDYLKIDSQFGTNETFKKLVAACHERGIRVMLDAVFNHCGHTFPPFVDAKEKGQASKYADWFHVREWPLTVVDGIPTYDTFSFEPIMPKLNTENPEVKEYLFNIARFWIEEAGIDGWRLDVANEVDHKFWREFRDIVKGINPDTFILGEIFHDSIPWLQGDQFDAVMNYPFTNAVLEFFAHRRSTAAEFTSSINTQLAGYPRQINETAFNLLGSHDTIRLLTLCGGNVKLMKLASLFQLTFFGSPCIYYGDEIGIDGEMDPLNRKCMEWDPAKQDQDLFAFFKRIIALRKQYTALRTGNLKFQQDGNSEQTLVYERWNEQDHFLILINNSDASVSSTATSSADSWTDVESGNTVTAKQGQVTVELPAFGYSILHASRG